MVGEIKRERAGLNEVVLAAAESGSRGHKVALIRLLYRYQIEHGLLIKDLARRAGIAPESLSRLYGGDLSRASTERLLLIFAALGLHTQISVDFAPAADAAGLIDIRRVDRGSAGGVSAAEDDGARC